MNARIQAASAALDNAVIAAVAAGDTAAAGMAYGAARDAFAAALTAEPPRYQYVAEVWKGTWFDLAVHANAHGWDIVTATLQPTYTLVLRRERMPE